MATADAPRAEALPVVRLRHPGQWIAAALVAVLAAALLSALAGNENIEWRTVLEHLTGETIVEGVGVTLVLTVLAMLIGVALGVAVAVMRISMSPLVRGAAAFYLWIFRGTPVLVQLLFWFNLGLLFPTIFLGVPFTGIGESVETNSLISGFTAALLGLGLNEGAYMAEIVRGGMLSVDRGQGEAAQALGLSQRQTLRRIVLPQALRVIVPPAGNEVITMLKTTSLVAVISGADLLTSAQNIYSRTFEVIELLIVASLWYLALTTIATYGQRRLESRLSRGYGTGRSTSGGSRAR